MNGWRTALLGELCDILDCQRKPITKRDRTRGEYPYYGATGIVDHVHDFIFDEPLVLVGEDGAKWASGENTAFRVEGKCWVNNHAHVLRPHRNTVLDNWLVYFLNHSDLSKFVSGLTVPKLNQGSLCEIPIPFPALSEQRRIVDILDKAFDGLARATANAEQNLRNACALFESHLQSVFIQRGKGWVEKRLGDVCKLFQGLAINQKTRHLLVSKSSLPLLRIKDLRDKTEEQYVSEKGFPPNSLVNEEDILYTRTGNSLGLVFTGRRGVLHNNSFKIAPDPSLRKDYLFWWLQNPTFKGRIFSLASKAAQPDITHVIFKAQPIFVPPPQVQKVIVDQVVSLSFSARMLENIYQQKLAALGELKKSLLHQAFNGKL